MFTSLVLMTTKTFRTYSRLVDNALYLALCMLGNLSSAKMLSAEFLKLAFFYLFFYFKNTIRIANSLDPDETPRLIWIQTLCKGLQN